MSTAELTEQAPLSQAERAELLRLARLSIGAGLALNEIPSLALATPVLLAPGGAFVTLHTARELRGCVGTARPSEALYATVVHMARAAAFDDPRFPPLTAIEWPQLEVEISRLSPPRPVRPDQVVPGKHGLYIIRGPARGLLLPQVAARYDWSRERFLSETCRKAGLAPAAWQDPLTQILVFEAEIFAAPCTD